jgi:hypothetical protein
LRATAAVGETSYRFDDRPLRDAFPSASDADGCFTVMDVAPRLYQVSVRQDSVDGGILRLGQIEIRKGYYYGEIAAQFPAPKEKR